MQYRKYLFPLLLVPCLAFLKSHFESAFLKVQTKPPASMALTSASYQGTSLRNYAFGFENLISSLLWVQVLQEHDHRPVKGDEVSWEFAQLDSITTLDPKFESAYAFGSLLLSVLRRDRLGGRVLLEKWVNRHPTYWKPTQMLGMHYFAELGDYEHAAPLIVRAAAMKDSPPWLSSLGVRLLSDTGTAYTAISGAIELFKINQNPSGQLLLLQRIRGLNFKLQKQHWNEALNQFKSKYKKHPGSLSELIPFQSENSRQIASLVASQNSIPKEIVETLKERFEFRVDVQKGSVVAADPELELVLSRTGVYIEQTFVPRTK